MYTSIICFFSQKTFLRLYSIPRFPGRVIVPSLLYLHILRRTSTRHRLRLHADHSVVSTDRLDILVRPHGRHLLLERLERELERAARVSDLELLQYLRVQHAKLADLEVALTDV